MAAKVPGIVNVAPTMTMPTQTTTTQQTSEPQGAGDDKDPEKGGYRGDNRNTGGASGASGAAEPES